MCLCITNNFENILKCFDFVDAYDKVVKDIKQYSNYILLDNPAANFDKNFKKDIHNIDFHKTNFDILNRIDNTTPFYVNWDITDYINTQTGLYTIEKKIVIYRFAGINGIVVYNGVNYFNKYDVMRAIRDIK